MLVCTRVPYHSRPNLSGPFVTIRLNFGRASSFVYEHVVKLTLSLLKMNDKCCHCFGLGLRFRWPRMACLSLVLKPLQLVSFVWCVGVSLSYMLDPNVVSYMHALGRFAQHKQEVHSWNSVRTNTCFESIDLVCVSFDYLLLLDVHVFIEFARVGEECRPLTSLFPRGVLVQTL